MKTAHIKSLNRAQALMLEAQAKADEARSIVEEVRDAMQETMDARSDAWKDGDAGTLAQEELDAVDNALTECEQACDGCDNAQTAIDESIPAQ